MRFALLSVSFVSLFVLFSSAAADDLTGSPHEQPDFVVYAADGDAPLRSAFFRILLGDKEKSIRIEKAESIEQALDSKAGTLVLIMPSGAVPKLDKESLDALKTRKIIGIGSGAGKVFGLLGLEINWGGCVVGPLGQEVFAVESDLLGKPSEKREFAVLQRGFNTTAGEVRTEVLSLFMPRQGNNSSVVDVLARWSKDQNYAPVARQGNFVFIGIPDLSTDYSAEYRDFIRQVCVGMRERKMEAFTTAVREQTKPGTYQFELAPRDSTDKLFNKNFYFRFTEAKRLTAKLEHNGSDKVTMLFMGEDDSHLHWQRTDAEHEERLTLSVTITAADLNAIGDRYWSLDVTNFGNKEAKFKLTITVEDTDSPQK